MREITRKKGGGGGGDEKFSVDDFFTSPMSAAFFSCGMAQALHEFVSFLNLSLFITHSMICVRF